MGRGGGGPRANVLLGGNKFCRAKSFVWQQVLNVNKFYEARSFMWQQVLYQQVVIDNKFYIATHKQVLHR